MVLTHRSFDSTDVREISDFGKRIAAANKFVFHLSNSVKQLTGFLMENPLCIVFWDVELDEKDDAMSRKWLQQVNIALSQHVSPERVFVVADKPLNTTPNLFNLGGFNTHIIRRFSSPGCLDIYSRLTLASLQMDPFGVARYLPDGTPIKKLTIDSSGKRFAAVEAVNSILTKKGVHSRLAGQVSMAVDELLMNAIHDAPVLDGKQYRKKMDKAENFQLTPEETVDLEIGYDDDYIAIGIGDHFGSLRKEQVIGFIKKDYQRYEYQCAEGQTDTGSGLGIYGVIQNGLSLLFISKPGVRTEVLLVFPLVKSIRDFKQSFRFFGFIGGTTR